MSRIFGLIPLYLLQQDAVGDTGFRQVIARLNLFGFRVFTAVAVLVPLSFVLVHLLISIGSRAFAFTIPLAVGIAGALVLTLARTEWLKRNAVYAGCFGVFLMASGVVWTALLEAGRDSELLPAVSLRLALIVILSVFILSLHPMQALVLGLSIVVSYIMSERIAVRFSILPEVVLTSNMGTATVLVFALLATLLSAVTYRRIYDTYTAHQAQSRLLVSENAAIMGRFTATLSHELNSRQAFFRA